MSNTQNLSNNENSLFSLEETRNGYKTIKVNGIYLHSKYDPIKEATSFVNSNLSEEESPSGYLVLGLGLGYHIAELANRTEKRIIVLESNKNLCNLANDICGIEKYKRVRVISNIDIDELFFDPDFVEFLSERPKTIVHPSSFKADTRFYQNFLSYRSSNLLNDEAVSLLKNNGIEPSMNENETFRSYSERLSAKNQLDQSEKLVLATYAVFS